MKRTYVFFLSMVLFPFFSVAQWSTDASVNNPINTMSGEQAIPKIATCPNGDSYIASFSNESGNYNVRMQRLDSQGNELWATNGILISNHPQMTWLTDWDMTADASNYAILTFQDIRNGGNNNVVAYRIAPDGSFAWGADGIALSNSTAFDAAPKVTVTASGNAVFAWQADDVIIMQKVSPGGTLMWGDLGITFSGSNTYSWPQLLPVGTDDVIMKYFEDTGPPYSPTRHVYAQRYDANGTAVWSSPTVISNAGGITAWTQIFPFINDGSDGFFIAWHDDRDNNMRASVYVQHVSSSGTALFTANGIEASTQSSMNHFYAHLALPPGSSDIYVFWNEMNGDQNQWGIYGQKISSSGARLWPVTGQVIIGVSSVNVYPFAARSSPSDMIVFYEEYVNSIDTQIKAMRIDANGGFVWSPYNPALSSVISEKVHPVVNDYDDNQWIASWEDDRSGNKDIYAQNIQLSGELGPYNPQIGTIEGQVTLVGGSAGVELVTVSAAGNSVNPDATGFYSMDVPSGTWDVIASLDGYIPDTVFGVTVTTGQTTSGVDLTLQSLPTGFIEGTVTLNGGSGNVTNVVVNAGYHNTNPDDTGYYSMEVEIGTYDVTASLAGYVTGINPGIVVTEGQTASDVDFLLEPVPTTGFIEGTVELQNNAGDVTQVDVTAGEVTVHPDATGFYSMEITAGTWDVSASLEGFYTQVVQDVVVEVGQVTPDIDFFLYQVSLNGYIAGYVTLFNGSGDVTEAEVSAGDQTTNPSANGHYYMALPPGTYTVLANHPYTLSDSITDITVEAGVTVDNLDFDLEVVRADLVCMAVDNWGNVMNNVDVEVTGPDSTCTGTITGDSLVFGSLTYGTYYGSAWWEQAGPVDDTAELGESNHYLIFVFDLTGMEESDGENSNLQVFPNPFRSPVNIAYELRTSCRVQLNVYDVHGMLVRTLEEGYFGPGAHKLTWDGRSGDGQEAPPGIYTMVLSDESSLYALKLIKL